MSEPGCPVDVRHPPPEICVRRLPPKNIRIRATVRRQIVIAAGFTTFRLPANRLATQPWAMTIHEELLNSCNGKFWHSDIMLRMLDHKFREILAAIQLRLPYSPPRMPVRY